MKRERPHYRGMALPTSFVRRITEGQLNLAQTSSGDRQRSRTRKIFIIKKTSRLPSTNAAGKKIRRILIFDNHPDSLRLIFGERANPYVDLSVPQRVSSWELIVVSILTMSALFGMVWPLFCDIGVLDAARSLERGNKRRPLGGTIKSRGRTMAEKPESGDR